MAEDILHYGAVRLRATGAGSMKMQLKSLDDATISDLLPLDLSNTSGRENARLSNVVTQRARLKIYTTEINEVVVISKIVIFVKPIYTSYPM